MPNRILKETICTSDTISQLAPQEEVFFYRLLVQVDDYGRLDARPVVLRARCYPLALDRVTDQDVGKWLGALVRVGLVTVYTVGSRPYLQFVTWQKHQRIRATKSKYPGPEASDGVMVAFVGSGKPSPEDAGDGEQLPTMDDDGEQLPASGDSGGQVSASGGQLTANGGQPLSNVAVDEDESRESRYIGAGAPTEPVGSPAGNTRSTDSLETCLAYLRNETPLQAGERYNPCAAVARLFTSRFGNDYAPDYGRLGGMARDISGGYTALAKVVWQSPQVQGDPHDYLQKVIKNSQARRRPEPGAKETRVEVDPEIAQMRKLQRDAAERRAREGQLTRDGAQHSLGAAK